jgi:hypothetical protein
MFRLIGFGVDIMNYTRLIWTAGVVAVVTRSRKSREIAYQNRRKPVAAYFRPIRAPSGLQHASVKDVAFSERKPDSLLTLYERPSQDLNGEANDISEFT